MKRTLEQGTGRAAGQQPFDLNSPNAQTRSTPGATGSPGTPGSVGTPAQHKALTMASRPAPGDAFSLDDYESVGELSWVSDDDSTDETPELFSEKDLTQRTELKVENDTSREDLQTLRLALPSNTTITRIASAIDTVLPQEESQRVLDVLHFADIRHA